jgi:hypothetical protein
VEACFASSAHSRRRRLILAALKDFLANRLVRDFTEVVFINGGFVSAKPKPKDVDIVLGLVPGTIQALMSGRLGVNPTAALALLQGKLSATAGGESLIHSFPDDVGGPKYNAMRSFFQLSDRPDEPPEKGILRVEMR